MRNLFKNLLKSLELFGKFGSISEILVSVGFNCQFCFILLCRIRALGSAALNLCMVAMGAADVNFEYGLHAWDMAAGDLIVREAGGVTMDPAGGPLDLLSRRMLAASSEELANEIVKLVTQYYPEPRD